VPPWLKPLLFVLALVPFGRLFVLGFTDGLGANPVEFVTRSTGTWALVMLCITLAITPLRTLFPAARWLRWLARRRRYFGVAVFGYSALHAAVYLARAADFGRVLGDALTVAIGTGWVALAIMLALAVTSNDASVRRLKQKWRWLHRAVYAAALLTFAHWVLTAFDPLAGYVHLGVLVAVELLRFAAPFVRKRSGAAAAE